MTNDESIIVTLTQIMAVNGHVPRYGGWVWSEEYAGATHRINGVVGEVVYGPNLPSGRSVYVCVQGCADLLLPNNHPDYRPTCSTIWVQVPKSAGIDWNYVRRQYHTRDGWKIASSADQPVSV